MARRKNPAAVALGRLGGGAKGARARWAGISAEERSRIMRKVRAGRKKKQT